MPYTKLRGPDHYEIARLLLENGAMPRGENIGVRCKQLRIALVKNSRGFY